MFIKQNFVLYNYITVSKCAILIQKECLTTLDKNIEYYVLISNKGMLVQICQDHAQVPSYFKSAQRLSLIRQHYITMHIF
jgi:predicted sulfurtransferase